MNRDIITIPFPNPGSIIVSTDTSGGIGNKPGDLVQTDPEMVAYYCFRVAVMECMSGGGIPFSVIIQNFTGDSVWGNYVKGVERGLRELELNEMEVTGSTETNFHLNQSAIGVTILGRKRNFSEKTNSKLRYAVIGKPLVGNEVLNFPHNVAPLSTFRWCCEEEAISSVLPVGSKGIFYEFSLLHSEKVSPNKIECELDLNKTSGPSTCFIISYLEKEEKRIHEKLGSLFYPIRLT